MMIREITFIFVSVITSLVTSEDLILSETLAPGYELKWLYDGEYITFQLSGPTVGWLGIGFSPGRTMEGADLIMCGVKITGENYILDSHATGNNVPLMDRLQDGVIDEASETDGRTMVQFTRRLRTGDPDDKDITDGFMNVIWAHGEADISDIPTFFDYHNNDKGFRRIQFIRQAPRTPFFPPQVPTFTSPTVRSRPAISFPQPVSSVRSRITSVFPTSRSPPSAFPNFLLTRPAKTTTIRFIPRKTTLPTTQPPVTTRRPIPVFSSVRPATPRVTTQPPVTTRRPVPAFSSVRPATPRVTTSRRPFPTSVSVRPPPSSSPPTPTTPRLMLELPYATTLDPLGRVELKWGIAEENFVIEMSAPTQGWMGFGISPGGTMAGADMIMMGAANGQGYAWDTFANANGPPRLDQSQDIILLWFSQNGTHTTVMVHRYISSTDPEDLDIQEGVVNVIWAYGDTDFDGVATVENYHGVNRGMKRLDLLQRPIEGFVGPPTLPPRLPVTTEAPETTLRLVNSETLDIDQMVTLKWVVDSMNIIIQITAPTRGWIGLGFSPDGTMAGADIIMMGTSQGQGYLLDTYATRNGLPQVDDSQDVKGMSSSFNGTHTTVMVHRLLNTGDDDDMAITDAAMNIIWAYGSDDITEGLTRELYHGRKNRGSVLLNLISPSSLERGVSSEPPPTTTVFSTSQTSSSAATSSSPATSTTPSTTTAPQETSTNPSTISKLVTSSKSPPSTSETPVPSTTSTMTPKAVPASVSGPEVGERSLILPGFGHPPPTPPKMIRMNLTNAATLDADRNVILQWSVEEGYLHLEMTAPTLGWMGVGFSPDGRMRGSDIIMMGVKNREGYALDAFVKSGHLPILDESQDAKVIFHKEVGKHTTVRVKKPLKTDDTMDRAITEGEMFVIWAYGKTDVMSKPVRANYHGRNNRGYVKLEFIHSDQGPVNKTIVISITAFSALLIVLAWKLMQ